MIAVINSAFQHWSVQRSVVFFLGLSMLAIPISSTGKSVCVAISLGLIVFSPIYRGDLQRIWHEFWCKATILLCLLAVVACFWGPANFSEKITIVEKYSKLLYLPILAVGFRDARARRIGLHAFLFAMTITCAMSMLKYFNLIHYGEGCRLIDPGDVFRNHIMTGYMMAFAAYLSSLFFLQNKGTPRVVYAILTIFFNYQLLFINTGRTGYVLYLLLMMVLVKQQFSWRQTMVILFILCSFFTISFYVSPTLQLGIKNAVDDYKHFNQNEKDSSVGFRLQFHDYAFNLFKRHPVIGNGTGSFTHLFHQETPVASWATKHLLEPHSQYWLTAAEFGVVGLVVLFFFFSSLFYTSWQLYETRVIAIALLFSFIVGNLSDSLLFYSGTGYFFIYFMALCLGERVGIKHETY